MQLSLLLHGKWFVFPSFLGVLLGRLRVPDQYNTHPRFGFNDMWSIFPSRLRGIFCGNEIILYISVVLCFRNHTFYANKFYRVSSGDFK